MTRPNESNELDGSETIEIEVEFAYDTAEEIQRLIEVTEEIEPDPLDENSFRVLKKWKRTLPEEWKEHL